MTQAGAGPSDDRALLAQVAAGSEPALEALYRRHETRLFRYLTGMMGGDAGRAGEVTCETFFEVWKQASTFRGESSVSTWIVAIARHRALSLLRRSRRAESDDAIAEMAADDPDALARVTDRETVDRVREALTALSPEHREALELACSQDFSYTDIARILDCPVNTVKTRVYYARQHLKRALAAPR